MNIRRLCQFFLQFANRRRQGRLAYVYLSSWQMVLANPWLSTLLLQQNLTAVIL